jgi:hypothetical protein
MVFAVETPFLKNNFAIYKNGLYINVKTVHK